MSNKVKIIPVNGKKTDAIEVFAIDAKEAIAAGTHELLDDSLDIGEADWVKGGKKPAKKAAKKEGEVSSFENMNTKELNAFVKENSLEIEGFADLDLPSKRKAVEDAMSEKEEL